MDTGTPLLSAPNADDRRSPRPSTSQSHELLTLPRAGTALSMASSTSNTMYAGTLPRESFSDAESGGSDDDMVRQWKPKNRKGLLPSSSSSPRPTSPLGPGTAPWHAAASGASVAGYSQVPLTSTEGSESGLSPRRRRPRRKLLVIAGLALALLLVGIAAIVAVVVVKSRDAARSDEATQTARNVAASLSAAAAASTSVAAVEASSSVAALASPSPVSVSVVPASSSSSPSSSSSSAASSSSTAASSSSSSATVSSSTSSAAPTATATANATTSTGSIVPGAGGPFSCQVASPAIDSTQNACVQNGMFALTFDDGPYTYTHTLLDILDRLNVKATFFVNGNNFGSIFDYADVLQRALASGHQIGSHTWSHANLSTVSDITSEMVQVEAALRTIIGFAPTFMRPPYGEFNSGTVEQLGKLGYRWAVVWNADPKDYDNAENYKGDTASYNTAVAEENFASDKTQITRGPGEASYIHLSHDVWAPTVEPYTENLINWLRQQGWTNFVTVRECLGETLNNAYKP